MNSRISSLNDLTLFVSEFKAFSVETVGKIVESNRFNHNVLPLPVWEHCGEDVKQYSWSKGLFRAKLKPIDTSEVVSDYMKLEWQKNIFKSSKHVVNMIKEGFTPPGVGVDYWTFVRWKSLHRIISSMIHVQATQSMLIAVGIGAKRSLPAAAGLNWVLKDGLGKLGRLWYVAAQGSSFDCHLKRVRHCTSILFTLSMGLETLTPLVPSMFLPMAAVANVGKSIGFAAHLATTSTVHRVFAGPDNLASVSAKAQAQALFADNVGLLLAMAVGFIGRQYNLGPSLPLVLYPPLAILDTWVSEREVRSVPLRYLNKERLEMIIHEWISARRIPSAMEISESEPLIFGVRHARKARIVIGPVTRLARNPDQFLDLVQAHKNDQYILGLADRGTNKALPFLDKLSAPIVLCLRNGSRSEDVIQGMLQACCLQNSLHVRQDPLQQTARDAESSLGSFARHKAEKELPSFLEALDASEWYTHRVLLGPQEQRFFSVGTISAD